MAITCLVARASRKVMPVMRYVFAPQVDAGEHVLSWIKLGAVVLKVMVVLSWAVPATESVVVFPINVIALVTTS